MDDKNIFSVRLNAGLQEALNTFKEMYEENNDSLKTDKAILEALIDTALAKYQPYKDNSQKIKLLEAENEKLKQTVEKLISEINDLNTQKNSLISEINNLKVFQSKISDAILYKSELNIVHKKLIEKYLKDKNTLKMFANLNKNGKYNGFFDVLNETDWGKFLLNVFLASALGKVLPAVVPNSKIWEAIDKQVKNLDL